MRLSFKGDSDVPREVWIAQSHANAEYPRIVPCAPHARRLAIVAGAPGVIEDVPEIRQWAGDIWGINYMPDWLAGHGIESTLFTADPMLFPSKARARILAQSCHPGLFAGEVRTFQIQGVEGLGIAGGSSSVTCAPIIALQLGYVDVSFFGCDGSFPFTGADHVDRHEGADSHRLIVRAGGIDHLTRPSYYMQCQELVTLMTSFPNIYHNRSRGLLRAMLDYPDTWEVVAVSGALKTHLDETNGVGMWEGSYERAA
jgi:hypothetical protein